MKERGFDFEFGARIFDGDYKIWQDLRKDYGEPRFAAMGKIDDIDYVVVYTEHDNVRRIISVRRANERERSEKWAKLFVKLSTKFAGRAAA